MDVVEPFIRKNFESQDVPNARAEARGRIVEESISPSKDDQKEDGLLSTREAVKEWSSYIAKKNQRQVYQTLMRGGEDKPKLLRMALSLPLVDPDTLTFDTLLNSQIVRQQPQSIIQDFNQIGPFGEGRQLHIEATINMSVLEGDSKYLCYAPRG